MKILASADREALTLTTIRSHDQYNTTIYGLNDRYRGITGRRDVVFVNERDLASRGLKHGDLVDISVVSDAGSKSGERVMRNLTAVAYNIAQGSIATYYPEANVLVALDHYDAKSGTPSYKSTPVLLRASPTHEVLRRLVADCQCIKPDMQRSMSQMTPSPGGGRSSMSSEAATARSPRKRGVIASRYGAINRRIEAAAT